MIPIGTVISRGVNPLSFYRRSTAWCCWPVVQVDVSGAVGRLLLMFGGSEVAVRSWWSAAESAVGCAGETAVSATWLTTTARRRALDLLRREGTARRALPFVG